MIPKKLVEYLSAKSKIKNTALVEKDFLLQAILCSFVKDKHISSRYAFKGGTCLVKCYLGYFRFSEDLDFTYKNQSAFKGKSETAIRKILSIEIDTLLHILKGVSTLHGFEFRAEKGNREYVELGGSNRFLTVKLWYVSSVTKKREFIKIQINFVEILQYPLQKREAIALVRGIDAKEVKFLFPEYAEIFLQKPKVDSYDIKEILIEKVRAILTRRGIKERDFVDVFYITNTLKKNISSFEEEILLKTKFMLKYEKYQENLQNKSTLITWIKPGEEKYLLLQELKGFDDFLQTFQPFLNKLCEKLLR